MIKITLGELLIIFGAGAGVATLLAIIFFLLGSWLMFKGKSGPGEGFFREPKGDVFRIPDNTEDFPGGEQEKTVIEKTKDFLSQFSGGAS
jgi:hypothetical protein